MTVESTSDVVDWFEQSPDGTVRAKLFAKQLNVSLDMLTPLLEELHLKQPSRFILQYDVSGVASATQTPYFARVPSRSAAEAFLARQHIDSDVMIQLALVTDASRDAAAIPQQRSVASPTVSIASIARVASQTPLRITPTVSYERVYRTFSRQQMISGEGLSASSLPMMKATSNPVVAPLTAAAAPAAASVAAPAVAPTPKSSPLIPQEVSSSAPVASPVAATAKPAVTFEEILDTPTKEQLPVFDIKPATASAAKSSSVQAPPSAELAPPAAAPPAKAAKPAGNSLLGWLKPKANTPGSDAPAAQTPQAFEADSNAGAKRTRDSAQDAATAQPAKPQPKAEVQGAAAAAEKKPRAPRTTKTAEEKANKAPAKPKALFNLKAKPTATTAAAASNLASLLDGDDDDDDAVRDRRDAGEDAGAVGDDDEAQREQRLFEEEQARLANEAAVSFAFGESCALNIPTGVVHHHEPIVQTHANNSPAPKRAAAQPAAASRSTVSPASASQPLLNFGAVSSHPAVKALQAKYKSAVRETTTKVNGEYVMQDVVYYVDTTSGAEIDEAEYKRLLLEASKQPVAAPAAAATAAAAALAPRSGNEKANKAATPQAAAPKPASSKKAVAPPPGMKTLASFFGNKPSA